MLAGNGVYLPASIAKKRMRLAQLLRRAVGIATSATAPLWRQLKRIAAIEEPAVIAGILTPLGLAI